MKTLVLGTRPSALTSVCSPVSAVVPVDSAVTVADSGVVGSTGVASTGVEQLAIAQKAHAFTARSSVINEGAVQIVVRTSPTSRYAAFGGTAEINNYMTTNAMGEGMTLSIVDVRTVSDLPALMVHKVKGGDARGIPPRGRPV